MKYVTETGLDYTALFAGAQENIVTDVVTIKSGEGVVPEGALLERGAGGYTWAATASSTDVRAVLLKEVDATSADAQGYVAFTGEFVLDRVSCKGEAAPEQALIDAVADRNIYFRKMNKSKEV